MLDVTITCSSFYRDRLDAQGRLAGRDVVQTPDGTLEDGTPNTLIVGHPVNFWDLTLGTMAGDHDARAAACFDHLTKSVLPGLRPAGVKVLAVAVPDDQELQARLRVLFGAGGR